MPCIAALFCVASSLSPLPPHAAPARAQIKFNRSYDLFAGGAAVPVPRRLEAWRTELAAICAVVVSDFLDLGGAFRSARWHVPARLGPVSISPPPKAT